MAQQYVNIWDTEGTGLDSMDEVIQLSGIITDIDLNVEMVYDHYCFASQEIHPAAYAVHQIDKEMLMRKSGGKYLEDVLDENPWFRNGNMIFIAYNQSYDKRLVNQTLDNQGLEKVDFGAQIQAIRRTLNVGRYNLCAMNLFRSALNYGINKSLMQTVLSHSGLSLEQLQAVFREFCKKYGVSYDVDRPHSALFDSFVIWFLLRKYKGLIYR